MDVRAFAEGLELVLIPAAVIGKSRVKRLVDVADEVDNVLERL